ncbi:hypothetical protein [Streptomyces qinglanensis]|uniref:hypothetical protein n=1 Tax=Streptomyces qinglanensis TaxID=943816 RepID=UPI003D722BC3
MSATAPHRKGASKVGKKALRWLRWFAGILVGVIIKIALAEFYDHYSGSENGPGC